MAVAGHDLSRLQESPDVLLELIVGSVQADIIGDLRFKKEGNFRVSGVMMQIQRTKVKNLVFWSVI